MKLRGRRPLHRNALRFCLWGGGERWVQIGSPTDRLIQIQYRMAADFEKLTAAVSRAILPVVRRMGYSFAELAKAFEQSGSRLS